MKQNSPDTSSYVNWNSYKVQAFAEAQLIKELTKEYAN